MIALFLLWFIPAVFNFFFTAILTRKYHWFDEMADEGVWFLCVLFGPVGTIVMLIICVGCLIVGPVIDRLVELWEWIAGV